MAIPAARTRPESYLSGLMNMTTVFLSASEDMRIKYYGDRALAGLRALADVRLNDTGRWLDERELVDLAQGCEVIVSDRATPAPAAVFDKLPDLRAFVRCAVDIRNVDVAAASANGVLVTHASPGFIDSVAELIFGVMIDLARGVSDSVIEYRAGRIPAARMGTQLSGAMLGIAGFGAIGRRVAVLGKAFGMTILVNDPFVTIEDSDIEQVDLPTLMSRCDFAVCLVVANDQTENLIDAALLENMKPGAFFINASRGNLVDEDALSRALTEGKIAGAAIDVGRAPDQMPTPELARLPNMIATPHTGGLTPQAIEFQAMETVDQVRVIIAGDAPKGAANADMATRLERFRS